VRLYLYKNGQVTGQLSIPQKIYEWIWSIDPVILTERNRWTKRKKPVPVLLYLAQGSQGIARACARASAVWSRYGHGLTCWAIVWFLKKGLCTMGICNVADLLTYMSCPLLIALWYSSFCDLNIVFYVVRTKNVRTCHLPPIWRMHKQHLN
jgi:hypothetical protein